MNMDKNTINMICSENSWIEGEAVRQLHQAAALDGMIATVGLPDMHPGSCGPVGAAFLSQGMIYPALIGNDVGCGIGLFATRMKKKKIKIDKWIKRLKDFDQPFDGDPGPWHDAFGFTASDHDLALGTIGGGNHFTELQSIDTVYNHAAFDRLGLDAHLLVILVHSGARSIGEGLFRGHAERYGAQGLKAGSSEAERYLAGHEHALKWAACNRAVIADRFAACLNTASRPVIDVCHNSLQRKRADNHNLWLHRKGAASSETGFVVIPGSRGSLSYLVEAKGDQERNLWSLPHGAGRKWTRGSCKGKLRKRFPAKSLVRTALGSHVICEDKDLLYEEAPQAYKNIDDVIADLQAAELVDIVATLKPVITYKMRKP